MVRPGGSRRALEDARLGPESGLRVRARRSLPPPGAWPALAPYRASPPRYSMARLLAAALALTLLAGCGGDDELDRVDGGMEVAPAPAAIDAGLEDGGPTGDVNEPFVDPDDVYDTGLPGTDDADLEGGNAVDGPADSL